jgi:hypothetical protein
VEAAAARAGEGAGQLFFVAGEKSARQFVKAIEATIPELQSVLDVIAEMIIKALGIRLDLDITGRGTRFIELPDTAPTPAPSPFAGPFTTAKGAFEAPALGLGSLQFFAEGGIVTSPMMGVVGEAGPEAIIPLDRLGGMGGDTFVINVSGAIDPEATARQIRRILQDAERRSGVRALS